MNLFLKRKNIYNTFCTGKYNVIPFVSRFFSHEEQKKQQKTSVIVKLQLDKKTFFFTSRKSAIKKQWKNSFRIVNPTPGLKTKVLHEQNTPIQSA